MSRRTLMAAAVLALCGMALAQDYGGAGAVSREQAATAERLQYAAGAQGEVAEAARDLRAALDEHAARTRQTIAPLLALLPTLSQGIVTQDMQPAAQLAQTLEASLPLFDADYARISAAAERMRAAAEEAGRGEDVQVARSVVRQMDLEREVLVPAAFVAADYIRMKSVELPPGVVPGRPADTLAVRATMARAAAAALTAGGNFAGLATFLATEDRLRLSGSAVEYQAELLNALNRFHAAWREQYGRAFYVTDDALDEAAVQVSTGTAALASPSGEWPVSPAPGAEAQKFIFFGPYGGFDLRGQSITPGEQIAVAAVEGVYGLPPLRVSLVREGGTWAIDVPDDVSGFVLRNNLTRHLDVMARSLPGWPAEADAARALAIRHVMMALYSLYPPTQRPYAPSGAVVPY